jgi:hypothetical protein
MPFQERLNNLKLLNLPRMRADLAIVRTYKQNRQSTYIIKYVRAQNALLLRLKHIVEDQVQLLSHVQAYTADVPESEYGHISAIDANDTDFRKILDQLIALNPEEDVIHSVDELIKAKAYLIVLRNKERIEVVAFKTVPENWKIKKRSRSYLYNVR